MFPYPIAKPQKCNIQTFYGSAELTTPSEGVQYSWIKPVGVSHVYMLLIGGGGNGNGTSGGGSGAVTVWYGAAQHVPNSLVVEVAGSGGGQNTQVAFRNGAGATSYTYLLAANTASGATGGTATTAGPFAASGFYKSTAGQDGVAGSQTASSTTFLSGGGIESNNVTANYGYKNSNNAGSGAAGFFQLQPIIVGVGGNSNNAGGIGCGGGTFVSVSNGNGGPGMVLIASW